jgi:hypothetical protein
MPGISNEINQNVVKFKSTIRIYSREAGKCGGAV